MMKIIPCDAPGGAPGDTMIVLKEKDIVHVDDLGKETMEVYSDEDFDFDDEIEIDDDY